MLVLRYVMLKGTKYRCNNQMDKMKTYIKPLTDIVILNTVSDMMLGGEPKGSLNVNGLTPVQEETIGGDDTPANSFNKSLWDEE